MPYGKKFRKQNSTETLFDWAAKQHAVRQQRQPFALGASHLKQHYGLSASRARLLSELIGFNGDAS